MGDWTPGAGMRVEGGCRNPRCGHHFRDHDPRGRCGAYHCRCRGWVGLTEREFQEGRR